MPRDYAYDAAPSRTRMGAAEALARGIPAELTTFVQKTYGLLAFSLLLAAGASVAVMKIWPPVLVHSLRGDFLAPTFPQWAVWLLWGGTVVFSIVGNLSAKGARQGETSVIGLLALCAMVICAGGMLAPTLGMMAGLGMSDVIVAAAVTTALTFTGLTAFVFLTGKNFTFMGTFLFMAFWAFFAAWMVGGFLVHSPGFQWWLAAGGTILFGAMILFHTSSVVHFYGPQNLVVPAVIALFMDILNLFMMLLVLFSGRRRE